MAVQLIRLLENKAVDALEVNTIQDEIEYYIESNREPDFFPNLELFQALDIENWNPVVKDKKKKVRLCGVALRIKHEFIAFSFAGQE